VKVLFLMAWRNLGRNRRRTAINLAAIAFATMAMVFMSSLQAGSYGQMIESAVKMQTGHLQLQHKDLKQKEELFLTVDHLRDMYAILDRTPGVVGATGRLQNGFLVSRTDDETFVALAIGTDPEREKKTSNWAKLVRAGEFLDPADLHGVLIGEMLALNLLGAPPAGTDEKPDFQGILGASLVLVGQDVSGGLARTEVSVRGVIGTGNPDLDRTMVLANLPLLQEVVMVENYEDTVHHIAILLESYELIPTVQAALQEQVGRLSENYRVLTWKEVAPGLDLGIQMDNVSGKITIFILLVVVAFGILNTFLMSAMERFREFGMMMAIGVKPRTCGGLLLLESQLLTVLGFAIGLLIGGAVAVYFAHAGIPLGKEMGEIYAQWGMPDRLYPIFHWSIAWWVFLQVWLVTSLTACYPARRITRFRPLEALRYQ